MSAYDSVRAAGSVGAVVNSVAASVCETLDGGRWLSSYIDPAHGNCLTIPDEDNTYSFAIQSKFLASIDSSLFVQSGYPVDQLPSSFNFCIYLTSSPLYPVILRGTQYIYKENAGAISTSTRVVYIYIQDDNIVSRGDFMSQIRTMYKGATITYTGNEYNNQGFVVSAPYCPPVTGFKNGSTSYDGVDLNCVPTSVEGITGSNRDYAALTTRDGVYGCQKFIGARAEYMDYSPNGGPFISMMSTSNPSLFAPWTNPFVSNLGARLSCGALCNIDWVCVAVTNLQRDQSMLIKWYGGYQCHLKMNSGAVAFQTNKSYLDMGAILNASKLNAVLPSVYPSSYNAFRDIWNKIRGFLKSSGGRNLVNAVSEVAGPFGGFIDAAYSLI